VCENCAVPQPPQQAQKRRSLGTPVRDSDLFPTSPSTPPAAPCWAKLSRAYLHPSSRKSGATWGPRLRRWIFAHLGTVNTNL